MTFLHLLCFSPLFPNTVFYTGEPLCIFSLESRPHKVDDLYYLCLFSDLAVRSLRDLRGEHVPILKRIQKVVINGLAEKHGVASSQLLAYVALIEYHTQWIQWIGFVGKIWYPETIDFPMKYGAFLFKISLKPIHWDTELNCQLLSTFYIPDCIAIRGFFWTSGKWFPQDATIGQ